ncbi:MAG: TolC family protein [Candidatus Rokuibacteriota bacterium]
MVFIVVGLIGTVIPRFGDAQAPPAAGVSVDDLVARALAENPELRAARTEVDAAKGRLLQAGFRPNPMLDLNGSRNLIPAMTDNSQSIGITWPLDLGGRRGARTAVAARELAVKEVNIQDRERRLAADIRMKLGELFAAQRDLRITEELLAANRESRRLIRERVREGAAPALEESLMAVEIARLEAQRATRAGRVEVLRLQLTPLVGLPPVPRLEVSGDIETPLSIPDRDRALARALEQRADLRMAALEVELGRARVERERAEGRYDASLMARYTREETGFDLMGMNGDGRSRPIQDTFHMLMFGVSIMLPVRHQNQGNIAAALAETEGAQRRREATELIVQQEVVSAYAGYDAAIRSAEIYRTQVLETARRNFGVVRQSYDLGRINLLDVVAEQRRLIELEMGYTEALKQRWDAGVEIQRAVGVVRDQG